MWSGLMVPAVSNHDLGNSTQALTPPATGPKGKYRIDSPSSSLNQVNNAVDYELLPRPWFETAGTICEPPIAYIQRHAWMDYG